MLNHNPLWRYLVVVLVLLVGTLYALPNLYPEDPAIQVTATRGGDVQQDSLVLLQQRFEAENIPLKAIELQDGQLLARFNNTEDQLRAREVVSRALGGNYVTALNMAATTPDWLAAIGASPMNLGLDLRGGVHFLMAIDMQTALDTQLEDLAQVFRADLREARIRFRGIDADTERGIVTLQFRNSEDTAAARSLIGQDRDMDISTGPVEFSLQVGMSEARVAEIREYALQQNITIIRNRVNEIGVAEPIVQRQGERIIVQLPGVQDTARAKEILGATATLEFRLVDDNVDLNDALAGRVPPSAELYYDRDGRPVVLQRRVMLTGDRITGANSSFDEYGRPQVNISLDAQGGNMFSQATRDAIGRGMATVFIEFKPTEEIGPDGNPVLEKIEEVINVATIQARLGRSFRITGINNPGEAHNLALQLRAGALLAPIQIIEERTIGPSLGRENIELGQTAIMYGLVAVLIFMVLYYRGFGLIANAALVVNLVLIVGVMSMIPGATLTLPGMAGIVLTVGMAVDANVLIFERIREELRDGRSVQQAIHHGYDKALSTIADANVTTLIAALILFGVGTGPIKGFAVTLMIGIVTSMFTAIVGTRLLVNMIWGGRRVQSLPI
ncbi:protein translocase subunit SecD [Alkalimonas collagenimarina]|uniref:Protein translocase subunit SecD n=1 Tax=Alkalimonas collagenimarina TaxID=400390 RepID=A0ABT9GWQ3_9GAMM|nr:protein translocase subunit SecD [Alkalimonas collagenimarina]MDP4535467.1 protein translocase subunit SecD [Alkalimonas collagenimarina]